MHLISKCLEISLDFVGQCEWRHRIYESVNWVSIGPDNGLSPVRRQAITWTNTDLLSMKPLETNFSEIPDNIQHSSLTKMHLKMSSAKQRPFCPRRDRLIAKPLQWHHNGHDGVSNHQPHDCLLNRYSGADQRKHQSSASLAFVQGIHRWPVNSPHKWPVTRKMFPLDDVIMFNHNHNLLSEHCPLSVSWNPFSHRLQTSLDRQLLHLGTLHSETEK